MSRLIARTCSTIALAGAMALLGALYLAIAAPAHSRARPDLVDRALGNPPTRLVFGGSFTVTDRVLNRGAVPAARSSTRYYLRAGRVKLLVGARRIRQLAPHRGAAGRVVLRAPATARAGRYSLIACADATRRVRESNERNNCRAARVRVTLGLISTGGAGGGGPVGGGTGGGPLPPGAVDSDHDGFPDNLDCAPHDASIHPGATDVPDLKFVDSNCDGIDGDASHAIFVATTGNDANPGTQTRPKRSLARAIAAAEIEGKDVYAAAGTFSELLEVRNQVGVYGGYTPDWTGRGHAPTLITGDRLFGGSSEAAVAFDISSPTTIQLLTLAPDTPNAPGQASYGLRGLRSPALRIDGVTVIAAPGAAGVAGTNGAQGLPGGNGANSDYSHDGPGGTSPVGHDGGDGGIGGAEGGGEAGGHGLATLPDPWGREGGFGGTAGAKGSNHTAGGPGGAGDSGTFPGDAQFGGRAGNKSSDPSTWQSDNGENATPGTDGHGGGGGGGGGSNDCTFCAGDGGSGGGGGGGGQGGGGGLGGQGGGGSFGIFLLNSGGAVIDDSTIAASSGGKGGQGGQGGFGGLGGTGASGLPEIGSEGSPGGQGGLGGSGGRGGEGGGGAGGPSVAIAGIGPSDTHNTTTSHSMGGSGGSGGAPGVDGPATDYLADL